MTAWTAKLLTSYAVASATPANNPKTDNGKLKTLPRCAAMHSPTWPKRLGKRSSSKINAKGASETEAVMAHTVTMRKIDDSKYL